MPEGSISCKKFTDFLIRRAEHFDTEIIRDVTPTDGWVGHVSTGSFPAGEGNVRQFDKLHRVYPDLSGPWNDVVAGNCVGQPCDPSEQKIGFGFTQESYKLQQKSYGSDLFCFDNIMSADRAKEQFAGLVNILKDASNIIVSDRIRNEALRMAGTKTLLAANLPAFTYTVDSTGMVLTPSALPTSVLTVPALQRQVTPLMLNGALGAVPDMPPIFELVTDLETSHRLREGNAALTSSYRFTDFVQGGALFKYGITDSIGNFGIRIDPFPLRFTVTNDNKLRRVMPYTNLAASGSYGGTGIRGAVNQKYIDAPVQVDYIWNRMAMKSLVRDTMDINPMMPFAKRDFAGKWQFVMDNLGADANGCVIENSRRNKGKFIADFAFGTKDERPEWVIAFLTLRDRAKFEVVAPVFTAAADAAQDYSSANEVCQFEVTIETGAVSTSDIAVNTITCNGVNIAHPAANNLANQAALVDWLNANLSELGVWTAGEDATHVVLTGEVCSEVTITLS